MHTNVCMYVCIYVYMYMHTHEFMYVCMHVLTYVHTYKCMYVHKLRMYAHMYVHVLSTGCYQIVSRNEINVQMYMYVMSDYATHTYTICNLKQ